MTGIGRTAIHALASLLLVAASAVHGQQGEKARVVGYLASDPGPGQNTEIFRQGMRERGWVEGQNLRIEYRWAAGDPAKLAAYAQELVRLNVDLIVGRSTPAVQAAKNATSTIPIVMSAADAEGSGFVAQTSSTVSLKAPGPPKRRSSSRRNSSS